MGPRDLFSTIGSLLPSSSAPSGTGDDPQPGPAPAPADSLPPQLLSARVVVISDFNCPYCFSLNEWLWELGMADRVRWLGIEHKPHLPTRIETANRPEDRSTLETEVSDVISRFPELGVQLPDTWVNSQRALLLQSVLEDEDPERAPRIRRQIFRSFWCEGRNIAEPRVLADCLEKEGLPAALAENGTMDPEERRALDDLTGWWVRELDRIPCMLAPTGSRHLGLQNRDAVAAFVLGALRDPPPASGCR